MKKNILVLSACLLASSQLYASYDSCAYLSIVIANNGNETCYLTNANLKYGYLDQNSGIPQQVYPNSYSQPFEMRQSFFGPEVALTYQCGQDKQITVDSMQNYCLFYGGKISGQAYNSYRMGAEYTMSEGSFWGRHGEITWYLHS